MTMTPLDFSMISGLRFTERRVLQIPDLTWGASEAAELLGPVVQHIRTRPVSRGGHRSGRSELASVLAHGFDIAETTPEQRVRIFILILISGTLSHDRSSRALICYLPSLVRIGEIGSYSWASIGYADLLSSMRHGCRQLNNQSPVVVYGLWRVVELWFYEYFPGLAPRRRRGAVHDFPVGASWRDRGESRVESVSSLRGLLRRGTSTVGVAVEIQYRPWDGMTNLPEALELSACRTVFFGTTRFVWYLGERVVRQHSANHFVVSLPPPESMLDSRLLGELLDRGERYMFPWQELVRMESDYSQELLPSLAPPPRLPETTARRRGKVELPPQSVRYPGLIGMIEEHIADAPEGFRQAQESMPDEFEPLTHSDMMGFMKLIDDLKHFIIKLRCGASCQSGSDDANEVYSSVFSCLPFLVSVISFHFVSFRSDRGLARARGIEARTRGSLVTANDPRRFVDILGHSGSSLLRHFRGFKLGGHSLSFLSHFRRLSGSRLGPLSRFRRLSGNSLGILSLRSLSIGRSLLLLTRVYFQFHCLG
ncbi:uncharacterized protein LOC110696356 isoform X2 [Chenopodium quinoa]|uniref:uncharacterized protein LOC110696356 isoform X2 n=1 Tax=Chenopodium quinoa TaxID=63459 RepID=UPI000B78A926|nr:uncharacterized protein LOC110696356 isoform X2 [Chenopodium quinoa]